MGVIYKITSPSGKIYVGKALNLKKRFASHRYSSNQNGSTIILYNSIKKYGWNAHIIEILETVENEKLNEREMFWINHFNAYVYENSNGMNMTKGGDGNKGSWMHRNDLREQKSRQFSGKGNPFYGKTHSDEMKEKLSIIAHQRNIESGRTIPKWGAEKGRLKIIKAVVCYGNDGNFIGEYVSLTEAAKKLNIKINGVKESLIYGSWYFGIYLFKYKTSNYPQKIEIGVIKVRTEKRAVLYIKDGEVVKVFPSSLEASQELGVPKTTINRASYYNNMRPIRTGHIFIYKDLYEKIRQEALN